MSKNGSLIASEILIVDDEEDIRDLIAGILHDEGYTTRVAGDSDGALSAIRDNLARAHLEELATIQAAEVMRWLASASRAERYDLAFLDPPYEERAILAPLERLVPLLEPNATVVVKHFWRTEVPAVEGLRPWRERRFGETALTFLEVP